MRRMDTMNVLVGLRPDYPQRIGPTVIGTGTLIYTVPSPFRVLLTDLHLSNASGGLVKVTLSIAGAHFLEELSIGGNSPYQFTQQCWPLNAGESVVATADVPGVVTATLTVTDREDGSR